MTDISLHRRSDADLEAALRDLATAIDWPTATVTPGPDVAATVRTRIEATAAASSVADRAARSISQGWTWRPARRALVLALLAILALAAVAGAVGFGIPGLRLLFGQPSPTPGSSLVPVASPSGSATAGTPGPSSTPAEPLDFGVEVPLAELDARAGFAVGRPTDPSLGVPDAAYFDGRKRGQVTLVWGHRPGLPDTTEPGIGLLLTAFRGTVDDGFFTKVIGAGTTVERVLVHGREAYWLSGDEHLFFYETPDGEFVDDARRWVGDVLLWSDGDISYRLETTLGRDDAIRLAETVD